MNQNNKEQSGIMKFLMVAMGVLIAGVSAVNGANVVQAEENESTEAETESVTESLAQATQSIYIDANVLSDYESGETKVTGETVPDADVTITYPDDEIFTVKADNKGQFSLESLPELEDGDEVQVTAEKDGQRFEIFFNYKNN